MLSDPGLERKPILKPDWWRGFRRFCGVFQAKSFEGVLILARGHQTCDMPPITLFLFQLSKKLL